MQQSACDATVVGAQRYGGNTSISSIYDGEEISPKERSPRMTLRHCPAEAARQESPLEKQKRANRSFMVR
jgi:hypothetical protein